VVYPPTDSQPREKGDQQPAGHTLPLPVTVRVLELGLGSGVDVGDGSFREGEKRPGVYLSYIRQRGTPFAVLYRKSIARRRRRRRRVLKTSTDAVVVMLARMTDSLLSPLVQSPHSTVTGHLPPPTKTTIADICSLIGVMAESYRARGSG